MIEVKEISIEEFEDKIKDKYEDLFVEEEKRDWDTIKDAYNNDFEKFYAIYSDNTMIGFFMLEKIDNYPYYLDYIGIFKEYQSKGYGSESMRKLLTDIVKEDGLIGEVEKVTDEDPVTVKRWRFYERSGFKKLEDACFLFRIIYNIIIYPTDFNITGRKAGEILLDYYKMNIGEEETKKVCKIID